MPPRGSQLWIFIGLSTLLYALLNAYVLRRGWRALAGTGLFRTVLLGVMIAGAVSFIGGRIMVLRNPCPFTGLVAAFGYWYLVFILYLFLLTAAVDLLRLADAIVPFFPAALRTARTGGRLAFALVFAATLGATFFGMIHALHIRLQTVPVSLAKPAGSLRSLRAALISDVHLSPIHGAAFLRSIVARIDALSPDVVFIAGDLLNEDTPPGERAAAAAALRGLRSRFGVFACTGNHEYFGGIAGARRVFRDGGVNLLEDETALVGDAFTVVGRKDRSATRMGESRKPLADILAGVDRSRPVILLDHQPVHLEEAAANGIDLQLSGHTHNGQIFPVNLINKRIYELNFGLLRKSATWFYVSSGAGTWGPPVRIGSTSEIVLLEISFPGRD